MIPYSYLYDQNWQSIFSYFIKKIRDSPFNPKVSHSETESIANRGKRRCRWRDTDDSQIRRRRISPKGDKFAPLIRDSSPKNLTFLSTYTDPRVVPNLYEFLSSVEYKIYFMECWQPNSCRYSHWLLLYFFSILWKSMATSNCYQHSSKLCFHRRFCTA